MSFLVDNTCPHCAQKMKISAFKGARALKECNHCHKPVKWVHPPFTKNFVLALSGAIIAFVVGFLINRLTSHALDGMGLVLALGGAFYMANRFGDKGYFGKVE